MATTTHLHLLLLTTFFFLTTNATTTTTTEDFIRSSCKSTRYPSLCISSLSSLPSPPLCPTPRSLATAALSISLRRARSASSFFSRLRLPSPSSSRTRAAVAARDCVENLADSVDRIRSSIREMDHMGRAGSPRFAYHLANVQTWVSAALTDEGTCLDGLCEAGKDAKVVRVAARRHVVGVARVTSNALALVNRVQALV